MPAMPEEKTIGGVAVFERGDGAFDAALRLGWLVRA